MKKLPIHKLKGEVFAYESEDIDKVVKAFELFFPKKTIKQESVDGGFGTRVKILRARASDKKARELAKKILSSIKKNEKEAILEKLKLYVDKDGKFYLRFDKQLAFEKGKIKLTSEEESSIQIVFALEAYPGNIENYMKSAENLLQA